HPLLEAAADGDLPPWAEAGKARREHVARVAELLDGWARAEGIPREERRRWRAAGILHAVLREAAPTDLRRDLPPEWRDLPDSLLHGPAGAVRLRDAGVRDAEFLHAIAYHTVGHPRLGA